MTVGNVGRVNGLFVPVLAPLLNEEAEGRLEWMDLQTSTPKTGAALPPGAPLGWHQDPEPQLRCL